MNGNKTLTLSLGSFVGSATTLNVSIWKGGKQCKHVGYILHICSQPCWRSKLKENFEQTNIFFLKWWKQRDPREKERAGRQNQLMTAAQRKQGNERKKKERKYEHMKLYTTI